MRTLHIIWLATLLLFAFPAKAEKWTPETLPMVHLQDAQKYVCSPDGILSEQTIRETDLILRLLEQEKGVETVVVVVKQIEGDDPFTFGMELAKRYGIGSKKQDTGLIVFLATEDRSYQILTGKGLEGTLPDAICRRIQNRVMIPQLKQKQWDAAIYNTIKSIDSYIRQDASIIREQQRGHKHDSNFTTSLLFTFILLGGTFFFIVVAAKRQNRCPKCKKGQLRVVKREKVQLNNSYVKGIRVVYKCPHCGYEKIKYLRDEDFHNNNGGPVPPFFMGGPSHRSGGFGGGSIGGSFGGGDFGGGGSGGRF